MQIVENLDKKTNWEENQRLQTDNGLKFFGSEFNEMLKDYPSSYCQGYTRTKWSCKTFESCWVLCPKTSSL